MRICPTIEQCRANYKRNGNFVKELTDVNKTSEGSVTEEQLYGTICRTSSHEVLVANIIAGLYRFDWIF